MIAELDAAGVARELDALSDVLHACVAGGASVSFVLPFEQADAQAFWQHKVLPAVAARTRRILVARLDGRVAGTVQLELATPPNQPHRAEVMKLLVHPAARRRGLARALMLALEPLARAERRSLITLDTVSGGAAEPLYAALGYALAGVIPGYALDTDAARLHATSIMFKRLPG